MKGLMILAVTSFLVGIQASSISRVQKELAIHESKTVESPWIWILEELDGTSVNGALDEVQNIRAIVDVLHFLRNYKDVMGCSGNTCQWCLWKACFKISYLPDSNEFEFCVTYNDNPLFCKTVQARDFKYCKRVGGFIKVNVCVEANNVHISEGKACVDLTVSVGISSKTFHDICMGTSNHFNNAQLLMVDKQL